MSHSNDAWGEAAPSLQAALDERGYSSLPEPGSNEYLDQLLASKHITHAALTRVGARWTDPATLHYIGPGYVKHRNLSMPSDQQKFNDLEYNDYARLRIVYADLTDRPDTVLIAEGETDAAWLTEHYPQYDIAICPSGVASIAVEQFPQHAEQLARYRRAVPMFDADEAGRRNGKRLADMFGIGHVEPPSGSDWCEYDGDPPELPERQSRFMSARDLIVAELPELKSYLSNSIMPVGGQIVIHGAAKNYKSYVAFDLLARLATGRGWAGFDYIQDGPIRVGVVQYEIRPGYYQDRVRALLESMSDEQEQASFLDNYLTLDALVGAHITVDDKAALQAFYREVEDADLQVVLLDPVRQMMSDKDLNSEQDVALLRALINPLKDMGVTVILTHHDNKEYAQRGSGNPLGMTGSGAFAGDADTIVSIALPRGVGAEFTAQCTHRDMFYMLRNAASPEPNHFQFLPEDEEHGARFTYAHGRADVELHDDQLIVVTDTNEQPEI